MSSATEIKPNTGDPRLNLNFTRVAGSYDAETDIDETLNGSILAGEVRLTVHPDVDIAPEVPGEEWETVSLTNPSPFPRRDSLQEGTVEFWMIEPDYNVPPGPFLMQLFQSCADGRELISAFEGVDYEAPSSGLTDWDVPAQAMESAASRLMIYEMTRFIEHFDDWRMSQPELTLDKKGLARLKTLLTDELYHHAVASTRKCSEQRFEWEESFLQAVHAEIGDMHDFVSGCDFASEEVEIQRQKAGTEFVEGLKRRFDSLQAEELKQSAEFEAGRTAEGETFNGIYEAVSGASYSQLASSLEVFTKILERNNRQVKNLPRHLATFMESTSAGSAGTPDSATKTLDSQMDFLRNWLQGGINTKVSGRGNASEQRVESLPTQPAKKPMTLWSDLLK